MWETNSANFCLGTNGLTRDTIFFGRVLYQHKICLVHPRMSGIFYRLNPSSSISPIPESNPNCCTGMFHNPLLPEVTFHQVGQLWKNRLMILLKCSGVSFSRSWLAVTSRARFKGASWHSCSACTTDISRLTASSMSSNMRMGESSL